MKKITIVNESMFGGGFIGGGFDNTLAPSSYNVQGQGPGYVYSVLPVTDELQQKKNQCCQDYYIHTGCTIIGHAYNNPDKTVTGLVSRIVKRTDGSVLCLYVKDSDTNKFISVSPEDIRLITHTTSDIQILNNSTRFNTHHNLELGNGDMISGIKNN